VDAFNAAKVPTAQLVAARVNGELVGLTQVLPPPTDGPAAVTGLTVADPDGSKVFRHSAAHVLGAALEAAFGDRVWLCDGPPVSQAEGERHYGP